LLLAVTGITDTAGQTRAQSIPRDPVTDYRPAVPAMMRATSNGYVPNRFRVLPGGKPAPAEAGGNGALAFAASEDDATDLALLRTHPRPPHQRL
jgi:hypothetical protein